MTVAHDPSMKFHVARVNPGVNNYEKKYKSFSHIVHDEPKLLLDNDFLSECENLPSHGGRIAFTSAHRDHLVKKYLDTESLAK